MSITNTSSGTSVRNPATAILEWDAMEGNFKYYDSEAKERAYLKGKIEFIVLDQLSNVSGCCLLYTSPSPRDGLLSRMPSSA